MAEFDAILFDAGGVLLLPDPKVTGPLLEPFGGTSDEETLIRAHFAGAHAMDRAREEESGFGRAAHFQGYAAAAGVPIDALDDAVTALTASYGHHWWVRPMDDAQRVLTALAQRVPIGIVSNAGGQVEGDLARLGICGIDTPGAARVVCVVDSHIVGVSKPDPAIFDSALTALDMPASPRIAYVGDTVLYDVTASAAAGLSPLLHDPYGFHAADPHPFAPRTLASLKDLLDLV